MLGTRDCGQAIIRRELEDQHAAEFGRARTALNAQDGIAIANPSAGPGEAHIRVLGNGLWLIGQWAQRLRQKLTDQQRDRNQQRRADQYRGAQTQLRHTRGTHYGQLVTAREYSYAEQRADERTGRKGFEREL